MSKQTFWNFVIGAIALPLSVGCDTVLASVKQETPQQAASVVSLESAQVNTDKLQPSETPELYAQHYYRRGYYRRGCPTINNYYYGGYRSRHRRRYNRSYYGNHYYRPRYRRHHNSYYRNRYYDGYRYNRHGRYNDNYNNNY
ncbi:hypothetical protein [Calothrix sp. 336/3]|uniref:hypothetical protein n=1 Tax=Calothrix sp. 336/3 TaxID=1337936 RepID=UPI0004E3ED3E|nr:hypothetical protein [Calothrix sp. 336/3]